MAKTTMLDAVLYIDGNDLTNYTAGVTLEYQYAEGDVTTYGSGGAKEVIGGLEEGSVQVEFRVDYAGGALDSIMAGLVSRTPVAFSVKPAAAAISSSNPLYYGSILVNSWTPISGNVGDVASASRTYTKSGVILRTTTG